MITAQVAERSPKVPLVFGIIGHSDPLPEDEAALQQALRALLQQFQEAWPHTPLVVLTALAEGVNLLAAEVALEAGCQVRAPLPFPEEVYPLSTSFTTEAARLKYKHLLTHPEVQTLPILAAIDPLPGDHDEWVRVAQSQERPFRDLRHQAYADVGGYVVRHCNVLVAFWDGSDPDPGRPSGTAEYVQFKLLGIPPSRYPRRDSAPLGFHGESGPVIVIHTPRGGAPPSDIPAGTATVRLPAGPEAYSDVPPDQPLAQRIVRRTRFLRRYVQALGGGIFSGEAGHQQHTSHAPAQSLSPAVNEEARQFQETCQSLDDYNRDAERAPPYHGDALSAAPHVAAFSPSLHRWLRQLQRVRCCASDLANGLQPLLESEEAGLFGTLFLALAAFHLYAHVYWDRAGQHLHIPWLLYGFLLAIVLALGTVCRVWFDRLDERRLDYRALAEALRVRVAWALAGIGSSVADSYLGQLRSEVSWTRMALQLLCPPPELWSLEFSRLTRPEQLERIQFVSRHWVHSQVEYFAAAHHREHRHAGNYRRMGFGLAVLAVLLAASLVMFQVVDWTQAFAAHSVAPTPATPVVDQHPAEQHATGLPASGTQHDESPTQEHAHPPPSPTHPPHWLISAAGMLALIAGFAVAYSERRAFESLATQYDRMHTVFHHAEVELNKHLAAGEIAAAQRVLEALGREAIAEHAQWLILRRARPFELHIGG